MCKDNTKWSFPEMAAFTFISQAHNAVAIGPFFDRGLNKYGNVFGDMLDWEDCEHGYILPVLLPCQTSTRRDLPPPPPVFFLFFPPPPLFSFSPSPAQCRPPHSPGIQESPLFSTRFTLPLCYAHCQKSSVILVQACCVMFSWLEWRPLRKK